MRWRAAVLSLSSALAAEPAAAQAVEPSKPILLAGAVRWSAAPARDPVRLAPPEPPASRTRVSLAINHRVELVAGGRETSPGAWPGRRADGPAGRPRTPRGARVGLRMRW